MSDENLIPPSELKETIDTIAEFVAGKGRAIEEKILEREKDNPDFEFLKDKSNQYHAYYEAKLEEYAKSKGLHVQKRIKQREDPFENVQKAKKESAKPKKTQDDLRREMNKKKNLKPPPPDQFSINHPDIHILDSEIIKLTAQFVTRNGQKYLHALSEREANNPQFDFLKHTHKLFTYFTSLLDSYSKTFVPKNEYINKLKKYSSDQFSVLENWGTRYEYERMLILDQREKDKNKDDKAVVEQEHDLEVDWDDFIVVQVIEFDEEDDRYIEPDIQQMGIEDVSNRIDRADQDIKRELYQMQGVKEASEIEPGMKIVHNYQKRKKEDKEATQICPKCGKPIPLSQWTEHMRIELLDPKWREDKIDLLNREKNPMTAQGDEISRSLRNLVANRPDIGRTDATNQLDQAHQQSEGNKVIWDGHSNSITRTTANSAMLAQQQRRNLEEAMRNRPDMYANAPNLPPGYQPPQNVMQQRPPTQAQLLGYPAPPNQNQSQNQGHPYGLIPAKKANPGNQNNK